LGENESERLLRLSEIYAAALDLFDGDQAGAREWLLSPVRLNNAQAIDYARTDIGAREVRDLIGGWRTEFSLDRSLSPSPA
jgi:putative toxin-antitoxin system antitoxin component (TIGR02293 family)